MADVMHGEVVPHETKVTLQDLCGILTTDYQTNGRRSLKTLPCSLQHLLDFFGPVGVLRWRKKSGADGSRTHDLLNAMHSVVVAIVRDRP
jgi:hypothetical protein